MAHEADKPEDLDELVQELTGSGSGVERGLGKSLPQQIAEVLSEEIVEQELPAGTRLPELSLSERFGTSRAPIREALYLLTQEGLVERKPRKGAVIRVYDRQEIEELYRVRSLLERLALERICADERRIEACLATLTPIVKEMEKADVDAKRYHELNFSFHKSITVLSSSNLLQRLYSRIEGPLKVVLRRSFSTNGVMPKSLGEHLQLLSAIEAADVERACNLLLEHEEDGMRRALDSASEVYPR